MSFTNVSEDDDFDVNAITSNMKKCMAKNGCLYLDPYISAYHDIHKLLVRLGPVFVPLAHDVLQKLLQLDCLRKGGAGTSYATVEGMIEFETAGGELGGDDIGGGGCRLLVRLHRNLEFVSEFLRELSHTPDEERLSAGCQAAYRRTLAAHHPWLAQKAALLAMYALGTRGETLLKLGTPSALHGDDMGLSQCADLLREVHGQTQQLLEAHRLTELA
ncbi:ceramide-1-phosphate transfer protein-like [Amphibalanus amphitrite]|uniref:ceramide-1-phosphate transfer protein-like n=1 Tax=Amphibalanus amphitrite TaxID=1232801 RepID=UPI001C90D584|nr:ceramide-1-phosphate transfer protein-like [Amphibalanus amphitrite]XP_043238973.1 ceramide-1-phosphate transfer protein-like [Amphibalanus amphitrite]XP_043239052.1 ceramide-1-phosphate transfer protein-like [Amphibalanus amphitrite]XP_043239150.1 ceramide-1-phosphate transfer protein-like [Amphibalanus amphitrite]